MASSPTMGFSRVAKRRRLERLVGQTLVEFSPWGEV